LLKLLELSILGVSDALVLPVGLHEPADDTLASTLLVALEDPDGASVG
jgi:hypothetical protein